jgi:DNA-binding response OmpR family regulator
MESSVGAPPVILIAAAQERYLASVCERNGFAAVQVHTGTWALESAREIRPDTIILEADLPDMSGIDACQLLHSDLRIGHNVPILILSAGKPTPEQRVTALRAGAWDFLRHPEDQHELSLKLQTYVQAKRNMDVAFGGGMVDPTTGLHSRPSLARRARELGALMNRGRGALACLVFAVESEPADASAGPLLVHAARVCDVVGALSPTEFAVLAPGTDQAGAVTLAQRMAGPVRQKLAAGSNVRVGYDAVDNLKYGPMDPLDLLTHAATAVQDGSPEPSCPWVRRFEKGQVGAKARRP